MFTCSCLDPMILDLSKAGQQDKGGEKDQERREEEREKVEETTMRNNIRTPERGKNARERERGSRNKIYPLRAYMSLWERFLSKSP